MHIQRHAHTSTHVQSAYKRNSDNQAQEPGWEGRKKGFVRDLAHTLRSSWKDFIDLILSLIDFIVIFISLKYFIDVFKFVDLFNFNDVFRLPSSPSSSTTASNVPPLGLEHQQWSSGTGKASTRREVSSVLPCSNPQTCRPMLAFLKATCRLVSGLDGRISLI